MTGDTRHTLMEHVSAGRSPLVLDHYNARDGLVGIEAHADSNAGNLTVVSKGCLQASQFQACRTQRSSTCSDHSSAKSNVIRLPGAKNFAPRCLRGDLRFQYQPNYECAISKRHRTFDKLCHLHFRLTIAVESIPKVQAPPQPPGRHGSQTPRLGAVWFCRHTVIR